LAITHADADHMDGAEAVLRRCAPRELWLPRILLSAEFRPVFEAARESGTRIRFLSSGDSFAAGEADVTAIVCELCTGRNDRSLVLVFGYGEHRFLLTGDIEHAGEEYLIAHLNNPHIAVLKTPHHGSRNSTSDALLALTHPTVAIVSAGFENLYGHPHAEVLKRLELRQVSVLRTDLDGAATVSTDGRRLERRTQLIGFRSFEDSTVRSREAIR
jgi:competence protein ComEC